ncbi:MAG: PilZ domain-containing protein [Spirochaetales bacterium]|nr:PilZ domain-containing protein [Spirochaetales bacterium]
MKKTLVLGDVKFKFSDEGSRQYIHSHDIKEALILLIKSPETDSVVISVESIGRDNIELSLRSIRHLNATMKIFFTDYDRRFKSEYEDDANISFVDSFEELEVELNSLQFKSRKANRVYWPVTSHFYCEKHSQKHYSGLVLSLSSKGCFIHLIDLEGLNFGDQLLVTIHFKDFQFIVDAKIVRLVLNQHEDDSSGIAVEFSKVTMQTENYIQEIINEKLTGELFSLLDF